jgi:hypothetical protein
VKASVLPCRLKVGELENGARACFVRDHYYLPQMVVIDGLKRNDFHTLILILILILRP